MTGFRFRKSLDGTEAPATLSLIGANSVAFRVGDAIRVNQNGFAALVTAGDVILGFVVGVTDKNDNRINPDTGTLDVYTMASNNQTVAQQKVKYIPALPQYLFYNNASASLATTNMFQFMDLSNEKTVDVSTAHDTNVSQVRLVELDPDQDGVASKGLFQIVESFWAQSTGSGGIEP